MRKHPMGFLRYMAAALLLAVTVVGLAACPEKSSPPHSRSDNDMPGDRKGGMGMP
jgi:hypothetical protein